MTALILMIQQALSARQVFVSTTRSHYELGLVA